MSIVNGTIQDTDPSLIPANLESLLLSYLYDRYVHAYGRTRGNLNKVKLLITEQPKIIAVKLKNGGTWYPVAEVGRSLESRGLVVFDSSPAGFYLTEAGFDQASKSRLNKFLDWLNKNPGLISLIALILSIGGIFKGC